MTAKLALAAGLAVATIVPLGMAAGEPLQVLPRAGFYAGRMNNQIAVSTSRRQLRFVDLSVPGPGPCSGRVFGQFVPVSHSGTFHGRGGYDLTTRETFSGRFLTGSRVAGGVTRVRYDGTGRALCHGSAHFDLRWRRPL